MLKALGLNTRLSYAAIALCAAGLLSGSALAGGINLGPGVGAAPRVIAVPRAAPHHSIRPAMTQTIGGQQWRGHYGIPPQAPYANGNYDTDRQRAFHRRGYFPNGFAGYGGYPYYGAAAASPGTRTIVEARPIPLITVLHSRVIPATPHGLCCCAPRRCLATPPRPKVHMVAR